MPGETIAVKRRQQIVTAATGPAIAVSRLGMVVFDFLRACCPKLDAYVAPRLNMAIPEIILPHLIIYDFPRGKKVRSTETLIASGVNHWTPGLNDIEPRSGGTYYAGDSSGSVTATRFCHFS